MQNQGDSGRTGPWIGALKEEGGVCHGILQPGVRKTLSQGWWQCQQCGLPVTAFGAYQSSFVRTLGLCVQESVKQASICQPLKCM